MKDAATLLALAERVEALTGPDREADACVWWQVFGDHDDTDAELRPLFERDPAKALDRWCGAGWRNDKLSWHFPHHCTALIDAAMTLLPEGWDFGVASFGEDGSECHVWQHGWKDDTNVTNGRTCATPALALTAAALRAHAAIAGADTQP